LGLIVFVIGCGLGAGWGARKPFQRVADARASYIELDAERLLWVKNPREQVSLPWVEIRDVYATDLELHITGREKAEIPAEFENFQDLVSEVKSRASRPRHPAS
jgi:hypothetical protein